METELVTGLIRVGPEVDVALSRLMALGYRPDEVSLLLSDVTRRMDFSMAPADRAAVTRRAARGVLVGEAVGAVVSAMLLVGTSLLLPDVGLVVAGPLATSMMGAGLGAGCGVFDTLAKAGIPECEARLYATGLARGMIVIGAHLRAPQDRTMIEQIFRDLNAFTVKPATTAHAAPRAPASPRKGHRSRARAHARLGVPRSARGRASD